MIKCKNEDFQIYQSNLLRYASGLLRTRGFGNNKTEELNEVAKDIVQNTYLRFHNCNKETFVSEFHLQSFLKTLLYRQYLTNFDTKTKNAQFLANKLGEINHLEEVSHPVEIVDYESRETLSILTKSDEFRKDLSKHQTLILDTLLSGWTQSEIAKELNISKQAISDVLKNVKLKYSKFIED